MKKSHAGEFGEEEENKEFDEEERVGGKPRVEPYEPKNCLTFLNAKT